MHSGNARWRFTPRGWFSRLVAVLSVLCVISVQVSPVAASASGDGMWIEICSEFGVVMKQVDLSGDGETDESPCPACAQCPFCAIWDADAVPTVQGAAVQGFVLRCEPALGSQTVIANPAQFWPDNRGPPTAEETARMPVHDVAKAPFSNPGGVPWS